MLIVSIRRHTARAWLEPGGALYKALRSPILLIHSQFEEIPNSQSIRGRQFSLDSPVLLLHHHPGLFFFTSLIFVVFSLNYSV